MNDESITAAEASDVASTGTRAAEGSIEIGAPVERVWRALTEADELERWFPLEARVEPGEGGTIWMSWKNEFQGKMRILEWDPPRRLTTSWDWSGEGDGEDADAPGTAQDTDYVLEARGGRTFLRVVTSGFPDDAEWDEWVEGTRRGWRFELESLRHYLEEHDGEDRRVLYLRRRVGLSREDAWERLFGPDGFDADALGADPFDHAPPVQFAAVLEQPTGGVLRISLEPSPAAADTRDVTLWLQAWGGSSGPMEEMGADWRARLERLFPEGTTP